ncbi:MAG: SUMF1/EgtB/PvdO family nonheme iron enzyme [Treponema sp.]|jgi:formylglycine-generating enzyme required for sulfatase activity|nr:SUMF1/EgtB/PvdO family nonheme iron enzyme [Treponema sp.]
MKTIRSLFITFSVFILSVVPSFLGAQQKFALVIGNGSYTQVSALKNPVNDANDMEAALKGLGFQVDKIVNGSLIQMEEGVTRFKNRLAASGNGQGFFFYAGHGVQSAGENYLIPVDANIPGESYLRTRALVVQVVLDELAEAGNPLNVIVLDACRDNPFGWKRSGSRGLTVVGAQPSGSIIIYATSAGSTAADGSGRNGLFTGQLLTHLKTPGLEVNELFRRVGEGVQTVSNNQQSPAVYSQFFRTAYLGSPPQAGTQAGPWINTVIETGSLTVTAASAGTLQVVSGGKAVVNQNVAAGSRTTISDLDAGSYTVTMQYGGGAKPEEKTVTVSANKTASASFTYQGSTAQSTVQPAATTQRASLDGFVRIQGGTFTMGSPASEKDLDSDEIQHQVTVSSFYMGKYEVTQKEWTAVMGTNPSNFKGDNLPVETVSWLDAVNYCNKRSQYEGLSPAYTINGENVIWNWGANGYRLPTEAEWEYACRAGSTGPFSTGNNITTGQANYNGTYRKKTTAVGSFSPNAWGLYDMHGNVWEWCWDWYGAYSAGSQADPAGASSGSDRVLRGGSWGDDAQSMRSSYRNYGYPGGRGNFSGFRIVRF